MFAKHTCGDSRLKCIDCNETICPKCMVICAVGNRCKNCTSRFTSHALKLTPWIIVRTAAAGALIGFIFGSTSLLSSSIGIYGLIFVYFAGLLAGNVLHWCSAHKLGPQIAAIAAVSVILGSLPVPIGTAYFMTTQLSSMMADASKAQKNGSAAQEATGQPAEQRETSSQDEEKDASALVKTASLNRRRAPYGTGFFGIGMLFSSLIAIAIFTIGVVTPFMGWVPPLRMPFSR